MTHSMLCGTLHRVMLHAMLCGTLLRVMLHAMLCGRREDRGTKEGGEALNAHARNVVENCACACVVCARWRVCKCAFVCLRVCVFWTWPRPGVRFSPIANMRSHVWGARVHDVLRGRI